MACAHCESRAECRCPAGKAVCAVGGACPCGPNCPCPIPEAELPEPTCRKCPAPVLCGSFGAVLGLLAGIAAVFAVFLWWETTPLVAAAVLLFVPLLLFWVLLILGYFGRWGRRATVHLVPPPWFWWMFFLLAGLFGLLGIIALLDGAESRAGLVLVALGIVFAIGGWARMMLVLYRMLPPLVILPTLALIVGGIVLGVLGIIDGDEPYGRIALLGVAGWLGVMVAAPWLLLWTRGVRHQRMVAGLPSALAIVPVLAVLIGALMLAAHGYTRDTTTPPGTGTALGSTIGTDARNATNPGAIAQDTVGSGPDAATAPDDQQQEPQTFRLPLSDGRSLPIYLFDSGTELKLGIILPKPAADRCWILQYDGGIADSVGECRPRFLNDLEPVPASTLYESADSVIVLLQSETDIIVVEVAEILVAQGFTSELRDQYFRAIDASQETAVIEGIEFSGG